MKTAKLIIGIVSMVLFLIIMLQSCVVGIINIITDNDESSGIAGALLAFAMLIGGIVGAVTRKGRPGGYMAGGFYITAAIIGFFNIGTFIDLAVWASISAAFGLTFIIGSILMKSDDEDYDYDGWNTTKKVLMVIGASLFLITATAWLVLGLNPIFLGFNAFWSPVTATLAISQVVSLWVGALLIFLCAVKYEPHLSELKNAIIAICFIALSVLLLPINSNVNKNINPSLSSFQTGLFDWLLDDDSEADGQSRQRTNSPADNYSWKQFLKEYEELVDDYILLMEKYEKNPQDLSLMIESLEYLEKMDEWSKRGDKIKEDLSNSPDALREYTATFTRIINKLNNAIS
jgi:hypothetical protein